MKVHQKKKPQSKSANARGNWGELKEGSYKQGEAQGKKENFYRKRHLERGQKLGGQV